MEKRKRNRLLEYDYTAPNGYFVTVCTRERQALLSRIVGGDAHIAPHAELTQYGKVIEKYLCSIRGLETYVIMPNHIHMIVTIKEETDEAEDGSMWASTPTQSLPQRIHSFKTLTSKAVGQPLWQRSYYDHVIRSEQDYLRIRQYIDGNPAKWMEDVYFPDAQNSKKENFIMLKNVKCARCVKCGKEYEATPNLTNCECGGILDIIYDYDYIKANLTKEKLKTRPNTMWRYRELLPVEETTPDTPLRVGWSPLYEEKRLAEKLGLKSLWVKDDGQNPTASLKDRASAMAVAKAGEAGAKIIACSSTGNAASSLAGNAAAAGFKTFIFVPERAPKGKVAQLMTFGANVISVKGNYEETFELSKKAIDKWGWYNRNAAINPYLSEGKKTVSLEIAEQLDWKMPDYLAISVGDGCTIAGVWKGLKDLYAIGFIDKLPRLISAQAEGCHPINRAIATGEDWYPMEENTLADSIAVGVPRNADKALAAIRESNGIVVNVTDEEIMAAQKLLGTTCGVFGEPAGVTGTAAVKKLCDEGVLGANDTVVSVVTGNGLKDVANAIKFCGEPMSLPNDLDLLVSEFAKRGLATE